MLQVKVLSWEPILSGKALIPAAIINAPLPKQQKMPHPQKAHTPTVLSSCLDCIQLFFSYLPIQYPFFIISFKWIPMNLVMKLACNDKFLRNFIYCCILQLSKKGKCFLEFFNVTYFFLYFDISFQTRSLAQTGLKLAT